jgi:hypothetical protein
MSHDLFENTANVITWKRPGAKFVVDGPGFDGTIRIWEGPGDEPTAEELAEWTAEYVAQHIAADLHAESRITNEGVAGMYAVFELMNGSPPNDAQKAALRASMKSNLQGGS